MADDIDLSPLDKVRRMFGQPTLLQQMKAEKAKKAAGPDIRTTAGAFQQRQETLDAAMAELRRQSGTK
jgi:hypothetical protein